MSNPPSDYIPSDEAELDAEEGSDPSRALVPIEQRTVDFYGDQITAILVEQDRTSEVYVPVRPICDVLGLSWSSQLGRIKRDPILSRNQGVFVMNTPQNRPQEMVCLRLKVLAGWLFGITTSRVRPDLRERIERYQEECYDVLARAFLADTITTTRTEQTNDTITALEQVRQIGIALTQMAEQQIELERRQGATEQRLDNAAIFAQELNRRLKLVENRTAPEQFITPKQAGQISNQVKALAMHLTRRDTTKNHYGAVFGAIHYYFNVASIERLTRSQFDAVMAFLDEWREAADAAPPGKQLDLFTLDTPAAPQQTEPEDTSDD